MSGTEPLPPYPTVLRSLASAVLLDRSGDIELRRECRGAVTEWGGVYGQQVRLTGPWRATVRAGASVRALPDSRTESTVVDESWVGRHRTDFGEIEQRIAPLADRPGAVRSLTVGLRAGSAEDVTVVSSFEPFLLPVLVEGIRPVEFDTDITADTVEVVQYGFGLRFRSDPPPVAVRLDGRPAPTGRTHGRLREIRTEHVLRPTIDRPAVFRFEIVGGLERELRVEGRPPIGDPELERARIARADAAWFDRTPEMEFPDAPELSEGYRLARAALRRLYVAPEPELTGLVAGYPWYAAIWCRDVAWMLPAVAWLGDVDWAVRSVDSVLRFQSVSRVPILGGEVGELPMQIAPGPIFFYGTSDTTLYYPALAARLLRHGADAAQVGRWRPALERAIAWGTGRADPASGLLRHGGEAAELAAATASVARVRYGIDAVDTTIWDSTDRRDHAIDVQVLWHAALRASAELGFDTDGRYGALASRLATTVRTQYDWPQERYWADSLRAGAPVRRVRPNALVAIPAGLVGPADARTLVRRAAGPDLSCAWGVRTLSASDTGFSPQAYHDGQVWPIATAWAAAAALAAGETDLGLGYLATIARTMIAEGGQANECYRGDRPEPFNSCFLLGLSVGPFLATLFEQLWGLRIDARIPSLAVEPTFPSAWSGASLRRLRVGAGLVDLAVDRGMLTAEWTGGTPLRLTTRAGTIDVPPGTPTRVALGEPAPLG